MPGPSRSAPAGSCSGISTALGESLTATAPHVTGWLLAEHPGPWKRDPFSGGFDPAAAAGLQAWSRSQDLRLLALRHGPEPALIVASSDPRSRWLYRGSMPDANDLARLAQRLSTASAGETVELLAAAGMVRVDHPVYLVCTHAGRDACCGREGRPVVAALRALRPHQVWEMSHPGGHRFAANVLLLPHGLLYGRMTAADVPRLVEATESHRLLVDKFRGHTPYPPVVQAALGHLRSTLAADFGELFAGIDDLRPVSVQGVGLGTPGSPGTSTANLRPDSGVEGLDEAPGEGTQDVVSDLAGIRAKVAGRGSGPAHEAREAEPESELHLNRYPRPVPDVSHPGPAHPRAITEVEVHVTRPGPVPVRWRMRVLEVAAGIRAISCGDTQSEDPGGFRVEEITPC
ncbi:MAG: sucrase ferredoxin [Acidimicrobiales bacterium]